MKELQISLPEANAEFFCKILLPMTLDKNKEVQMFFSTNVIEKICKENKNPCYTFAHNLEGHKYWRLRIGKITLEYIVTSDANTDSNAYVYQIFEDGKLVYRRTDKPECTIYVHYNPNS